MNMDASSSFRLRANGDEHPAQQINWRVDSPDRVDASTGDGVRHRSGKQENQCSNCQPETRPEFEKRVPFSAILIAISSKRKLGIKLRQSPFSQFRPQRNQCNPDQWRKI
jgi:hypothetical protein